MNPKKWYDINNGGNLNDTRECIYGFPCRLILINDGNTPLNEGQNEPTPGNTKDMGVFNFNHDKDATNTMGFDDDVFPNCASYEVTANSDTSAGAFMRYMPGEHTTRELEGEAIFIEDEELCFRHKTVISEIQGNEKDEISLGELQNDGMYKISICSCNAPMFFGKGGKK